MDLYKGTTNVKDLQVQQSCQSLYIKLRKNTPVDRLDQFFGDEKSDGFDAIRVMYSPPGGGGQKQIISMERVFPIAIDSTTGENHMYVHEDANGKIVGCDFALDIGSGGALTLDQNAYLSVSTFFNDIASLEIFAIDGLPIPLVYQYSFENLEPGQLKDINMVGVNQVMLPRGLDTIILVYPDKTINMVVDELSDLSRVINNIMAFQGSEMSRTVTIDGNNVVQNLGFKATKTYSGDAFYLPLGITGMLKLKVKCPYRERVMIKRTANPVEL